jgi:hypothetical protein
MKFHAFIIFAALLCLPAGRASEASPTVESILAKHAAAMGGQAAIKKTKTRVIRADLTLFGTAASWTLWNKAPDQQLSELKTGSFGELKEGCDGRTAWVKDASGLTGKAGGLRKKAGSELARALRDAHLHRDIELKRLFPNLAYKGTEKTGGSEMQVLESRSENSTDRFYFDAKTGLLTHQQSEFDTPQGRAIADYRLSDFRAVNGIKYPYQNIITIKTGGQEIELRIKVREVQYDVEIDDQKFAPPEA